MDKYVTFTQKKGVEIVVKLQEKSGSNSIVEKRALRSDTGASVRCLSVSTFDRWFSYFKWLDKIVKEN